MKRLLPLFALMAAAGCARQLPVYFPTGPAVLVEHRIFSGLPDYSWNLTDEEWVELERRLSDLPDASALAPPEIMLDSRGGFQIVIPARGESAARKVYVAKGLVQIGEWGSGPIYRDVHGLEAWLNEQSALMGAGYAPRTSSTRGRFRTPSVPASDRASPHYPGRSPERR